MKGITLQHGAAMLAAIGIATLCSAQVPEPPQFMLTDLGTLGGEHSRALGMNDDGVVVGYSTTKRNPTSNPHAFLWQNHTMSDLGTLGGDWAEARDVNVSRMVVGTGLTADGAWHGFYWFDGVMFDLNDILDIGEVQQDIPTSVTDDSACLAPMRVFLEANSINDVGVIVGCGFLYEDDAVHGFALVPREPFFPREPAYTYVDLGQLPGATDCFAWGANDLNQLVGTSGRQAFICEDVPKKGFRIDFLEYYAPESVARAINNGRTAAGWAGDNPMQPAACMWQDGYRFDLGTECDWISDANDISDNGLIVGWTAEDMGHQQIAMLWEGCIPVDLNTVTVIPLRPITFPWEVLEQATAIDDSKRVAGFGRATDGRPRAFLLTPLDYIGDETHDTGLD